jgi:hypothetical protein
MVVIRVAGIRGGRGDVIGVWSEAIVVGVSGVGSIGIRGIRVYMHRKLLLNVEVHPDGVAADAAYAKEIAANARLLETVAAIGIELLHYKTFTAPESTAAP